MQTSSTIMIIIFCSFLGLLIGSAQQAFDPGAYTQLLSHTHARTHPPEGAHRGPWGLCPTG